MIRIAKIADDDGGADDGGSDDDGGSLCGRANGAGAGGGGFDAGRGGGGFDAGRGGDATGRGGFDAGFGAISGLGPSETVILLTAASVGSDGERAVAGAAASSLLATAIPGFERRRGIGGGELSGGDEPGTGGNTGMSLVRSVLALCGPVSSALASVVPEYEIVGAIGALSALDASALSSPASLGGREGGPEVGPDSRRGFGGGASLRDIGATES